MIQHDNDMECVERKFPYPIATRFVRLETLSGRKLGEKRLCYILETAEALTQFLGCIVLAEIRKQLEESPEKIEDFKVDIPSLIKTNLSWGKWMQIARDGTKWLKRHEAPLLIEEVGYFFWGSEKQCEFSQEAKLLEKLINIRNDHAHGRIKENEFADRCEETYPYLCSLLKALYFLMDYKLSFVNTIKVEKHRRHKPLFEHEFMKITGESETFKGYEDEYHYPMESSATLLLKPKTYSYLNLDPFLVYEEKAGTAKGVFFLNGIKNDNNALYTACKQGGSFESKNSMRCNVIANELEHLKDLFSYLHSKKE